MIRTSFFRWFAFAAAAALILGRWSSGVVRLMARWHRLAYERRLLASLDDRMLRDIGVTRSDAETESRKPFWRER